MYDFKMERYTGSSQSCTVLDFFFELVHQYPKGILSKAIQYFIYNDNLAYN